AGAKGASWVPRQCPPEKGCRLVSVDAKPADVERGTMTVSSPTMTEDHAHEVHRQGGGSAPRSVWGSVGQAIPSLVQSAFRIVGVSLGLPLFFSLLLIDDRKAFVLRNQMSVAARNGTLMAMLGLLLGCILLVVTYLVVRPRPEKF